MLDHVPDHVLDYTIIGLVTTALQFQVLYLLDKHNLQTQTIKVMEDI